MEAKLSQLKESLLAPSIQSKSVYSKWTTRYIAFCKEKDYDTPPTSSSVLLLYLNSIKDNYAPATLWNAASCINIWIQTNGGKNVMEDPLIKSVIKQKEKTSDPPKKAAVFSIVQLDDFLFRQPTKDLLDTRDKAFACISYFGALRSCEAVSLKVGDLLRMPEKGFVSPHHSSQAAKRA
eukprot:TRINITY_DN15951_c0_g1::TRINITY_DN15951_c0_g1_i1::g.3711::m.3711 TRINITY_DN15951_c0_g1::TRINITY_DN15951_c0_g1_i1::g.3711  ORF type:complete len:179 (+),score=14.06,Phage_integrase/PF00589.17/0.11 TRINITY_DN15951_c0_g1_i1:167-703(+)